MPEKEKIYSRQVSAPILKRKTSRFGLGQFLGSSSGNQNTSTASHSVATASNTLHTRSKAALPPCPVHHSQHTAFPYHHPPHTHTHHPHTHPHPHPYPHPYPHAGSSAQVATFATAHSQSHQYLVHCVPPSHHSPMPTLQEAETLLRSKAAQAAQQSLQQSTTTTAQQHGAAAAAGAAATSTTATATNVTTIATGGMTSTSSTGASTGHSVATSFHSHFQKHPSAPNLLPPQPLVTAPSPSPSALAFPMHCTCDVALHPSANPAGTTTGSTTANPGRL